MKKIAFIADIHFGYKDDNKLYEELNFFIETCKVENVDLIVIGGDLFDKKVSLASLSSILCGLFIHELVKLNKTIFLINGTESHDAGQLKSFSYLISNKFLIFNSKTIFNWEGYRFLILPEEYISDPNYYEKDYLEKVDFVFGHGMFRHTNRNIMTNKNNKRFSEVFDVNDFKNVKNYIVFGHVHTSSIYKNMIYGGSYSRFAFGESEDKGFWIFQDKNKKFYKNIKASTYNDIIISEEKSLLNLEINEFGKLLINKIEKSDFTRIIIDIPISQEVFQNIVSISKNYNVKILKKFVVDNIKELEEKEQQRQYDIQEKLDNYKNLSLIETTIKIALEDYGVEFTEEQINKLLTED